ncbi:MAG: hypothetical protein IJP18_05535 [Oscillospiraceae bacterium]|nr:hypothetical protein [Oscillospiraceae bacterium]
MQIYSTKFRVKEEFTAKTFVECILEWSKSRKYPINDIDASELSFIAGDDNNYLEVIDLSSEKIIAARTHEETNGGVWNTDFILNYGNHTFSMYINRSFSDNTINTESKAYMSNFVNMIIKKCLVGKSSGLDIGKSALCISDKMILEDAINTYDEYSLPVIYLSGKSRLTPDKLAAKLAGLAVVVHDEENVLYDSYPDPIYVFFPHRNIEPVSLSDYPHHREIQMIINTYHNNREYRELDTWNGIQNRQINISNREILSKYRNLAEDNEVITNMYAELESKINEDSELRDRLSFENNKLIAENARLMQELERLKDGGIPVIMKGKEPEIYADEYREIIISSLKDYIKSIIENSRRYDVISSVIEANPVKNIPDKNKAIIKNAFEGYSMFETAKITNALKETCIQIIEHSGHYKIALNGDHRYVCTAAATCSDSRGGKNLVSEINNIMF